MRFPHLALVALVIFAVAVNEVRAQEPTSTPLEGRRLDLGSEPGGPAAASVDRIREGLVFEGAGRFELRGDRATFLPEGEAAPLLVLENLMLERVVKAITDGGSQKTWQVSGEVTEYQGANYLLLRRAVMRSPSKKP